MKAAVFDLYCIHVSEIGAVVKAMDSQLCGRSSISDKTSSFSHSLGLVTALHVFCSVCKILDASWDSRNSNRLLGYQYTHTSYIDTT